VDKNKYLVGLIGLALGFAISFFLTTTYNKNNPSMATAQVSPGMTAGPGAPNGANQQAMMGNVAATIEKAKNNPKDAEAQFEAARVFYEIGRVKEAIQYLEKAGEIDPNNINIAVNLGVLNSSEKNFAQAEKWLGRAIELKPNEPDFYVILAETFIKREPPQPDRAIQDLQRALKVDPKNGHALDHLVEAYTLKKDARAAEGALNQLKQAEPSNERIPELETMLADLKAGKPVVLPKE
jgi:tetratricopeptide (TPR) repeat protein